MGRRGQWNFDQGVMMVVVSFLPSFRLMMMMTRLFIAGFIFCQGVGSCQQSETEVKSWRGVGAGRKEYTNMRGCWIFSFVSPCHIAARYLTVFFLVLLSYFPFTFLMSCWIFTDSDRPTCLCLFEIRRQQC